MGKIRRLLGRLIIAIRAISANSLADRKHRS